MDPSPPSPFLNGWQSVIPADYPYPLPTRPRTARQTLKNKASKHKQPANTSASPQSHRALPEPSAPSTHPNTSVADDQPTPTPTCPPETSRPKIRSKKTALAALSAQQPSSMHGQKPDKISTLFIPKPKIPPRHPIPSSQIEPPLFFPPSQPEDQNGNHVEDPFAEWGAGAQEASDERAGEKSKPEEAGLKEGEEIGELSKPLKLDGNLLEIIIRSVILRLKLLDDRNAHDARVDTLASFERMMVNSHPKKARTCEKMLEESTQKVMLIQREFGRVTAPISDELRAAIELSVAKHRKILASPTVNPNGLFADKWTPQPVQYLDSILPASSIHPAASIHPSRLQDHPNPASIENEPWADSWGAAAPVEQAAPPAPATAAAANPESECPWGPPASDEPAQQKSAP